MTNFLDELINHIPDNSERDYLVQGAILLIEKLKNKGAIDINSKGHTNWLKAKPSEFGAYTQMENSLARFPDGLKKLRSEIIKMFNEQAS